MKRLIIAEKPSLAKTIQQAIGFNRFTSEDGYSESPDYIITWAFGHLFSLLDIEDYQNRGEDEESRKWTLEGLPFCPPVFRFDLRKGPKTHKVDPGVRKQFGIIKKLCAREDVSSVIHAGDSDREGEIIVRIILEQAKNKKPVQRLWMPEQTHETIRQALQHPQDDALYDSLANEGYARTYIDWLYGINLTRLATVKSGTMLRVGRVIVPIVKAIYDRDMEIRNFTPEKYISIMSKEETNGAVLELVSKQKFTPDDLEQAKSLCERYNLAGATVQDIKKEEATIKAPKLYSLSKLQGVLGKKFKMAPKVSLALVQSLYEKGYVTYPRTNSEYLATAESGKINSILDKLKAQGYAVTSKDGKKSIYDDSKIESHSALTPTIKLAKEEDLKEMEWKVYSTILNRFLAVFCSEDCRVNRTTITIEINRGQATFQLKGDAFISKGWLQYDDTARSSKDRLLPQLSKGDAVNIHFKPVEKETSPPKHYTVDSLNNFLKNPFKKQRLLSEDEDPGEDLQNSDGLDSDDQDYKALFEGVEIGTEATRTSIIDNAIASNYILLKNNTYTILPAGEFLIQCLTKLGIDMGKEKTALLGRVLKRVYRGEVSVNESVRLAFQEIHEAFYASRGVTIDSQEMSAAGQSALGKCPKCGSDVVSREKLFGCTNRQCRFCIWKDNKQLTGLGQKVTAKLVKDMLHSDRILLKGCVSVKSGKSFDCFLIPDFSGDYPNFKIEFPTAEEMSIGKCPKCGGEVVERSTFFGCANKSCQFALWKNDRFFAGLGKDLTKSMAKSLLSKGKANLKDCTSRKTGKNFDCIVTVDFSGRHPNYEIQFHKTNKK